MAEQVLSKLRVPCGRLVRRVVKVGERSRTAAVVKEEGGSWPHPTYVSNWYFSVREIRLHVDRTDLYLLLSSRRAISPPHSVS